MEVSSQSHVPAALPPVRIGQQDQWVQETIWTLWRREYLLPVPGIEPLIHGLPEHGPSLFRLNYRIRLPNSKDSTHWG
jgi:hypothetical protein